MYNIVSYKLFYYCGVEKMRRSKFTEMNIYIYLNNEIDYDLIDKIKKLKSERKLNSVVIKLLREYIEKENQLNLF